MLPPLLIAVEYPSDRVARLQEAASKVVVATTPSARATLPNSVAREIRAVVTNGSFGLSGDDMARLPNLEMIAVIGAGYERVDLPAARARGIVVTNGAGANADTVADHAWALLLGAVRALPRLDAGVRQGGWGGLRQLRPTVFGGRMGIFGMGAIGTEIARRAADGFKMSVAYHNRHPRENCTYRYCASLVELANASDFLVVAAPGGAATRHAVNEAVLDALGSHGYLVNVGRGTVVDSSALVEALKSGRIAGAGLDVFDGEPDFAPDLRQLDNVVLTPHIAGLSPYADAAMLQLLLANITAHFTGQPVLTPIG